MCWGLSCPVYVHSVRSVYTILYSFLLIPNWLYYSHTLSLMCLNKIPANVFAWHMNVVILPNCHAYKNQAMTVQNHVARFVIVICPNVPRRHNRQWTAYSHQHPVCVVPYLKVFILILHWILVIAEWHMQKGLCFNQNGYEYSLWVYGCSCHVPACQMCIYVKPTNSLSMMHICIHVYYPWWA